MVEVFNLRMYRKPLWISWRAHEANECAFQRVGQPQGLLKKIVALQLGYSAICPEDCLKKIVMNGQITGSRGQGGLRTTWADNIKAAVGKKLHGLRTIAADWVVLRRFFLRVTEDVMRPDDSIELDIYLYIFIYIYIYIYIYLNVYVYIYMYK